MFFLNIINEYFERSKKKLVIRRIRNVFVDKKNIITYTLVFSSIRFFFT